MIYHSLCTEDPWLTQLCNSIPCSIANFMCPKSSNCAISPNTIFFWSQNACLARTICTSIFQICILWSSLLNVKMCLFENLPFFVIRSFHLILGLCKIKKGYGCFVGVADYTNFTWTIQHQHLEFRESILYIIKRLKKWS